MYRASYIPLTPDPLLMTVSWNGRQLKGCPLQINVTSAADASRVICSGDGLKHGIVGQEIRSFIDTRRAGPGKNYFTFKRDIFSLLDIFFLLETIL